MNPFDRFQIDHLSPSSLNMFAEEPAFWALKYIHKFSDSAGPAAWRGSAVEAGLDTYISEREEGAAQKAALCRFEEEAQGEIATPIDNERFAIPLMLTKAMEEMRTLGEPIGRQLKVEHRFDCIEVPVLGYTDYEWPDFGIDLKTTRRMPREIPPRHARQISLYQAARKKPFKLLYVTEKQSDIKDLTDKEAKHWLRELEWHAHAIRRAVSMFECKFELARLFQPDFNAIYWKSSAARLAARDIWGN